MGDLTNRPLVCVALGFAAGIVLAAAWAGFGLAVLGVLVAAAGVMWGWRRGSVWAGALAVGAAGLAGGLCLTACGVESGADVSRLPPGGQTLVGTVAGAPRYTNGVWRFVLAAEWHEEGARQEAVAGQVYVRLRSTERVERGQRWRLTGRLRVPREATNPGVRSEAQRLASLGVSAVMSVGGEELAEPLGQGELGKVAAHAYAAQRRALGVLERYVSGPYRELTAAVAASVIFGVHAAPPPAEISDLFRRAGTIHLLVVSGAIVSMVFGMVFLPGVLGAEWRRIRLERQFEWPVSGRGRIKLRPGIWAAVIAVLVVTYYAVLTEGGQAVARAAMMGVIIGVALALRHVPGVAREHGLNVDRYTVLAAAGMGILAVRPEALFQAGFQLSFAAVWAILFLTAKVEWLVGWLPRWVGLTVVGTSAAQLATFPILAWHYGQAPVAGFAANLLAVPLAGAVLAAGLATCALGVTFPWAAPAAGWVTGVCTRWMVWVSGFFGALPGASVEIARPSMVLVVVWYVGLAVLGWGLGRLGERMRSLD